MSNELKKGEMVSTKRQTRCFFIEIDGWESGLCSNISATAPVAKNILIPRSIGHNLEQFSALVKSEATNNGSGNLSDEFYNFSEPYSTNLFGRYSIPTNLTWQITSLSSAATSWLAAKTYLWSLIALQRRRRRRDFTHNKISRDNLLFTFTSASWDKWN